MFLNKMQLNTILLQPGADVYYDPKFRVLLEDHMTYLKGLSTTRNVEVDIARAYKYEGDLYGLLQNMGYPAQLHFIIMRINNLTSPADYNKDIRHLLIPDTSEINRIRSAFKTKNKT